MEPPILGVDNILPVPAVVGGLKTHIFKFWYFEYVRINFLVEPTFNGKKLSLLVGGCGTYVAIIRNIDAPPPP